MTKPITDEQLEKLKEKVNEEVTNYLFIELSYSHKIVLPYEDGIALLATLAKAETIKNDYSMKSVITKQEIKLETTILPKNLYIEYKMNHLLGVNDIENKDL